MWYAYAPMTRTNEDVALTFPSDGGSFACSASNSAGLRLTFTRRGDSVRVRHTLAEHFQGAPGVAHGGIVATLLDEVSCAAVFFVRGQMVVTGELSVRYERPCPVGRALDLEAHVTGARPRYLIVEAVLCEDGQVLARSHGKFFPQARAEAAP